MTSILIWGISTICFGREMSCIWSTNSKQSAATGSFLFIFVLFKHYFMQKNLKASAGFKLRLSEEKASLQTTWQPPWPQSFTSFNSTVLTTHKIKTYFLFWSDPVLLNWRPVVQWYFPHTVSVLCNLASAVFNFPAFVWAIMRAFN